MLRNKLGVLLVMVLAFGLILGSTSVTAQEQEPKEKALPTAEQLAKAPSGYDVVGCKQLYVDSPGTYTINVPRWCKNGRCEIFGEWWGEPAGAFLPGLTWAVNYIQLPDEWNLWSAGPAVNIAGVTVAGGWGNNGDSWYETILGPYMTTDGSYFELADDSNVETDPNKFSFHFHKGSDPGMWAAKIYVCKASKGGS